MSEQCTHKLVRARAANNDREVASMRRERATTGARVCALAFSAILASLALFAAPALALPEGRVYEMVSPVFKGGFDVGFIADTPPIYAVAPDGESMAFQSAGTFAGDPASGGIYLARRDSTGWVSSPMAAPPALGSPAFGDDDFSPTLESVLEEGVLGQNAVASSLGSVAQYILHQTVLPDTAAAWETAGAPLVAPAGKESDLGAGAEIGASADFCHVLFKAILPYLPVAEEQVGGAADQVYELDRGCDGKPPSLTLVGTNDQGKLLNPACALTELGDGAFASQAIGNGGVGGGPSRYNAVSTDGGEAFFTGCLATEFYSLGYPTVPHQLFVRLGETRTLEVSKPLSEPDACAEVSSCGVDGERASADFAGASEGGSRVFFTSAATLTAGDTDTSTNLFMAGIGCPEGGSGCAVASRKVISLVQVSHGAHAGEPAEVEGVVRVAPDGSRVYFVARGALSEGPNAQGVSPVRGADNLYVYDASTGDVSFIGELCLGLGVSGAVPDAHCPNGSETDKELWQHNEDVEAQGGGPAQTAGADGRFLVFQSAGQLLANDTDAAVDVYRYDALTGELNRVSLGEAGHDANGNGPFDATIRSGHLGGGVRFQREMDSRAISEDGSRIVFTSSAPLSPDAVNGLANVYEWHQGSPGSEGSASLISSGSGQSPINDAVISANGNDIFFVTDQGLLPQDTDGLGDVYDARLDGGFPVAPAPRAPCSGDACQGPLSNPAPLLVPGSAAQTPGENLPPATPSVTAKAKPKPVAKCKRGYTRNRRGRCVKGSMSKARKAKRVNGSKTGGRS